MTNNKIDQVRIERGGKLLRVWNVKMTRRMQVKHAWNRFLIRIGVREEVRVDTVYFDEPIIVRGEPRNQDEASGLVPGFGPLRIEAISDDDSPKSLTLVGRVIEPVNQDEVASPRTMVYGVKIKDLKDEDSK